MRIGRTLDACMTADALHEADMAQASATMLAVLHGELPAPRGLRWSRDAGGWGKHQPESDRRLSQLLAVERAIEGRRTMRDACPLCAVRADIGCKHRRIA
jgi:hypothetical protein